MIRILTGDCRDVLPTLAAGSVHCVVTSVPYWNLRDYGTAQWEGGVPECDHQPVGTDRGPREELPNPPAGWASRAQGTPNGTHCQRCGAKRIDKQIGLEATPEDWIAELVGVFRLVRRAMRDDATCWLNCGDVFRDKQLLMLPARLALALQADGWWLRSEIVWSKVNPMPESVSDRPTSAHEKVYLLSKRSAYFYDAMAVREEADQPDRVRADKFGGASWAERQQHSEGALFTGSATRNLRNVWTLPTQAFSEAHFAVFPDALAERCIKAGTSERGCCAVCGAPWVRQTQTEYRRHENWFGDKQDARHSRGAAGTGYNEPVARTTTGWSPSCTCQAGVIPCTVLDPFSGAGTALLVTDRLQRHGVGIELSESYATMARTRIVSDAPLLAWIEGAG